jgi:hypothetical protein
METVETQIQKDERTPRKGNLSQEPIISGRREKAEAHKIKPKLSPSYQPDGDNSP